jgi:hypothetical protein
VPAGKLPVPHGEWLVGYTLGHPGQLQSGEW